MRNLWALAGVLVLVFVCSTVSMWGCSSSPGHATGGDMAMLPGADLATLPGADMSKSSSGPTCSTGTLYAGNPTYNGQPDDRPTSGTGIKADPPLQWENMVFSDTHLYTRSEGEIWMVDLSAASPVETLIAGKNDPTTFSYTDGACATARFAQVRGIDALPDGSLVVADQSGNGILHIVNPAGANCTVEYWAGNNVANADIDLASPAPDTGDMDGPGASAQLNGPRALVADGGGNVFFYDSGNRKIKKIAADGAHTVSTLATIPANGPDYITNMTRIGTKLYAAGEDGAADYIFSIDTTSGAMANLKMGAGDVFPPLDANTFPTVTAITTDGTGLYVAGSGYLWYLTVAGDLTLLGGTGVTIDFPPNGYDPAASHSADTLVLEAAQGNDEAGSGSLYYITYHAGAIYFRGHADGTAAFIEKINCP